MSTHVASPAVAIIGAGQAGISVALGLKDRGVTPLLIDRSPQVAAAWRGRYDGLRLNTGRQFSQLPHRRYPRGTSLYPSRDDVVAYLDRHAREDGIVLRLGTNVERIDRGAAGWRLSTTDGGIEARVVVVATGFDDVPFLPDWPGSFRGRLVHSSQYRNALPYNNLSVLVVGSGSSGMEIAHDLASGGAAKVWLSIRTPPNIAVRSGPAGLPVDLLTLPLYAMPPQVADRIARAARVRTFGDLSRIGLPIPDEGPFSRAHRLGVAPSIVDPDVIEAIKNGSVEVVPGIAALAEEKVVLSDASVLGPDAVICATGFRPGADALVGHLDALTGQGRLRPATWTAGQGLYFHGLTTRPGFLGYVARQSKPLVRRIIEQLDLDHPPRTTNG